MLLHGKKPAKKPRSPEPAGSSASSSLSTSGSSAAAEGKSDTKSELKTVSQIHFTWAKDKTAHLVSRAWLDSNDADCEAIVVVREVKVGDPMLALKDVVELAMGERVYHMGLLDVKQNKVYHFNDSVGGGGGGGKLEAKFVDVSLETFCDGKAYACLPLTLGWADSRDCEREALSKAHRLARHGGLLMGPHGSLKSYDVLSWNCQHIIFWCFGFTRHECPGQAVAVMDKVIGPVVKVAIETTVAGVDALATLAAENPEATGILALTALFAVAVANWD